MKCSSPNQPIAWIEKWLSCLQKPNLLPLLAISCWSSEINYLSYNLFQMLLSPQERSQTQFYPVLAGVTSSTSSLTSLPPCPLVSKDGYFISQGFYECLSVVASRGWDRSRLNTLAPFSFLFWILLSYAIQPSAVNNEHQMKTWPK